MNIEDAIRSIVALEAEVAHLKQQVRLALENGEKTSLAKLHYRNSRNLSYGSLFTAEQISTLRAELLSERQSEIYNATSALQQAQLTLDALMTTDEIATLEASLVYEKTSVLTLNRKQHGKED